MQQYDQDQVDDMTLALLYLVAGERREGQGARAWRGFDSNTLNRLYQKGWIDDPKSKTTSLHITEEGFQKSQELFFKYFVREKG